VIAVLGCTAELSDAKRYKLAAGTWRLRATHTIAKRERIRLELWPAKAANPKVLVRWKAPRPPPSTPSKGAPKTRKQAVAAALAGKIDRALPKLLELHAAGDAAALASAAEILAFLGRKDEMRACAKALLATPDAVYAGNVSTDMRALLKGKPGKPRKPPKPDRACHGARRSMTWARARPETTARRPPAETAGDRRR
jgi:hypothetical protein